MTEAHAAIQRDLRVFISAAEPSADRHGATLIGATRALCPRAQFVGVAGPRMVEAGCERVFDMSGQAGMLLGALKAAGRAAKLLSTADERLRAEPFDACVVIDSPTLHLPLMKRAKAAGVPTLFYIAPQMWAWGTYRIHKLRDQVDAVAAILPFEEPFFRGHGIDATFVGHPLAEQIAAETVDHAAIAAMRKSGNPMIAILPGSRTHVVEEVLPGQLEVVAAIARALPGSAFGVPVASPRIGHVIDALVARAGLTGRVVPRPHAELIRAADLAIVASGTTALEIAFHETPMIVMYNASRLFYHVVGRWMLHTKYLSLPNILAGMQIVPEFMPYYRSTEPIIQTALALLKDADARQDMSRALANVVAPLREGSAARRTAELLISIAKPPHR